MTKISRNDIILAMQKYNTVLQQRVQNCISFFPVCLLNIACGRTRAAESFVLAGTMLTLHGRTAEAAVLIL